MLTFKHLFFIERAVMGGIQALQFFNNGYGISVVQGGGTYNDGKTTYEVAVLKGNKDNWELCYDTPITDDVMGYQTSFQVTDIMRQIQKL